MTRSFQKFLSLLLFLIPTLSVAVTRPLDRIVVAVNDEVILDSDVDKFQEKLKSKSYQELFGGIDPSVISDKKSVLQLLVEEKIINQQVRKLDLQATDQEVDGQIKAIAKRNGITFEQLTDRLKQLGTPIDDYREGIKRQIERKNLIDREIKPSLEVSEEQLRHFYVRHGKSDALEVQYHIAHILISTKGKSIGSASDRAKTIDEMVKKAPADFEKIAKEYSDDTGTSQTGGDLGFLPLSAMSKEFKEVVPKLSIGVVSAPIKTSVGFHILKLLDSKTTDFAMLPKEQKEMIRAEMINSEVEKKMLLWLERKKAEAHITQVGALHDDSSK